MPVDPSYPEEPAVRHSPLKPAAVALALLVMVSMAGCSTTPEPEPKQSETSSEALVEPTETPTPDATAPAYTGPLPDISALEAMSVEEFAALTSNEQMVFAAAKLLPAIDQFALDYQSVSEKPSDALPIASIDNTAQEIDTLVAYNLRFVLAVNQDDREKFILAVLRNNNQSGMYPIIEDLGNQVGEAMMAAKMLGYSDVLVSGSAMSMGDLLEDTNFTKYRLITNPIGTYSAYFVELAIGDTIYRTWIRD